MKSKYRFLRIAASILKVLGAVVFTLSLANFCFIVYVFKWQGEYISNPGAFGRTFYLIIAGAVLFLSGAIVSLLCDIADNSKRIADKT